MNHAVEKFIWQTHLGMKDKKVIQEAITSIQQQKMKAQIGVGVGVG